MTSPAVRPPILRSGGRARLNADAYHAAFENGTMDDTAAGPRIRELRQRLTLLRARHAEL